VPSKPAPPDASDILAESANLTWQPPHSDGGTPVIGYHLERSTNRGNRWVRITKALLQDLSYPATGLIEGTEYFWRVVAVNARGESEPSDSCDFIAKNPWGKSDVIG